MSQGNSATKVGENSAGRTQWIVTSTFFLLVIFTLMLLPLSSVNTEAHPQVTAGLCAAFTGLASAYLWVRAALDAGRTHSNVGAAGLTSAALTANLGTLNSPFAAKVACCGMDAEALRAAEVLVAVQQLQWSFGALVAACILVILTAATVRSNF